MRLFAGKRELRSPRSVDLTYSADISAGQFYNRGFGASMVIYPVNTVKAKAAKSTVGKAASDLGHKVVAAIEPLKVLYPAAAYHQDVTITASAC